MPPSLVVCLRHAEKPANAEKKPACAKHEISKLCEELVKTDGTAVVCWEHERLAELVGTLLGKKDVEWPDDRFDVIWLLRPGATDPEERWDQVDQPDLWERPRELRG